MQIMQIYLKIVRTMCMYTHSAGSTVRDNMEKWINKVAIVTGASSGIGAAITKALVRSGMQVVGLARRKEKVDAISSTLNDQPGKLYSFKTDCTKEKDIISAFEWTTQNVGPVSVLISNAGIAIRGNLYDGDIEGWRRILDTNVLAMAIACREAIKIMNEYKIDGYIININGTLGQVVPELSGFNIYSASKFAAKAMTNTLRLELARQKSNIRITNIRPGYVKTDIMVTSDMIKEEWAKYLQDGDVGLETEDIAESVLYVLSTPLRVQVVGLARRKERVDKLSAELEDQPGKLYGLRTDLTKEEGIIEAFKWTTENVGPVSVLVNNAGIMQVNNLSDGDVATWRKVFDTNVMAVAIASKEAIRIMNENNIDGYIININSIAGHIVLNMPGFNVYSPSKYALTAMTETLRFELARLKSNIRLTNLSPGGVKTEIAAASNLMPDEMLEELMKKLSMTMLESEDIANAILYLLSTPLRVQVTELTIRPIRETNNYPDFTKL